MTTRRKGKQAERFQCFFPAEMEASKVMPAAVLEVEVGR